MYTVDFKETIDKAIRLVSFFRNSNNKFFISKLKDQQYEKYNKYFTIAAPGETRWNSYYYVCASLLKTQKALQILAIKFEPPISETRRQTGDNPFLKRNIYEIISSTIFWNNLKLLVEILHPYCKILDLLQSNKARLHEVIHSFGYIIQFWNEYSNSNLTTRLVARLEKRWKEWEQLLLIIACLLHPNYRMKKFYNNNINYATVGPWLGYYYHAWTGQHSKCILREYWNFANASTNELGFVACRIFGICVNAASVERLWSCMGFLHSNRRNRLSNAKVLEMSKLRADITYNHRLQKKVPETTVQTAVSEIELSKHYETEEQILIDENEQNNKQDNTEISSQGSHISENINEEETEDIDSEDIDLENINLDDSSEDDFANYLHEWMGMLDEEKKGIDELERIDNDETENINHLAIDLNAKWELSTLFIKLDFPFK
ncbi:hypothetical protein Glove_155g143 [Diversispora epigaea]|uniref:HAT C-terminal dimerisation domain-containing protein n=1 Tax=Diversispora epigaea TaxID=1348612 RepID=A0A397IV43_9GLOM|nr:hypothetical protein Glove_155g143 [Diversispora epigaea]